MKKTELLIIKNEISAKYLSHKKNRAPIPVDKMLRVNDLKILGKGNIHSIGIGKKRTDGIKTRRWCVQIFVHRKLPEHLLKRKNILPKALNGAPVDILERFPAYWLSGDDNAPCRAPIRPLVPGISASHSDVIGGTIGCFCRSTEAGTDDGVYVLSNNHVFADMNAGGKGDPVLQPSPYHCGDEDDAVAKLSRHVPLRFGSGSNKMDAAIAKLLPGVLYENKLPGGEQIYPRAGTVRRGDKVFKYGSMTSKTKGKVNDVSFDFELNYEDGSGSVLWARFVKQIKISGIGSTRKFARRGDSGALILKTTQNGNHVPVGLLFAASENGRYGYASPLAPIISELKIALI